MKPEIGQNAPKFNLPSNRGVNISLDSFKGTKVILYFYPKDDTPGCTKEACNFRNAFSGFTDRGVEVIGVSRDDTVSHEKFATKFNLPFTLLSDVTGETVENYGVWVEKNNYGKKYMGIERSTFLINENGVIEKIWVKVNPDEHIDEILDYLDKASM